MTDNNQSVKEEAVSDKTSNGDSKTSDSSSKPESAKKCDGSCLIQADCGEYETDGTCKDAPENECKPIRCGNFEICDSKLPQWVMNCTDRSVCKTCDIIFGGKLKRKETNSNSIVLDCPVCYGDDIKNLFKLPNCTHFYCAKCIIKMFFKDDEGDKGADKCPLCRGAVSYDWSKGRAKPDE